MVTQSNFWRSKNKKVARLIVWFTVCNFGHFWRENSNIYEISGKFEFSRQKFGYTILHILGAKIEMFKKKKIYKKHKK